MQNSGGSISEICSEVHRTHKVSHVHDNKDL